MTTTRKLIELFRAIAADDIESASAVALQVSKIEEKKGHRIAARALRGALARNGIAAPMNGRAHPTLVVENVNFVSSALIRLQSPTELKDVVLSSSVRSDLEDVISEWKHGDRLRKLGIAPRSKLLFHGPPGCGKSLTALALANALNLPIFMVRFDAVIGAYLGQTAIHLRQLFRFAETNPCVLLLDELDALGKRRGNPLDVGELDRIVISLLQELEHSKPMGIVIGTTNLPKHLDDALWRRFELNVFFAPPSPKILRSFVVKFAQKKGFAISESVMRRAVRGKTFAAAEQVAIGEFRRQALKLPKRK